MCICVSRFETFPRSRFHIITLEQYTRCDICELKGIIEFLGLEFYDPFGKSGYRDEKTLKSMLTKKWNITPTVAGVMDEGI